MRRFLAHLARLLCALALLVPCTACMSSKTGKDSVTLATYLASDSFDAASLGISSRGDLPGEVTCEVVKRFSGSVNDLETIADVWDQLCSVRIRRDIPTEFGIDDSDIALAFVWDDGRTFRFAFSTSEYFVGGDGFLYPTENPEVVRDVLDRLEKIISEAADERRARASEMAIEDGIIAWDADADGVDDAYKLTFHGQDEGELAGCLEIGRADGTVEPILIEQAAEIRSLRAVVDGVGPALDLTYAAAGSHGSDGVARCLVRLTGSALLSSPLPVDQ